MLHGGDNSVVSARYSLFLPDYSGVWASSEQEITVNSVQKRQKEAGLCPGSSGFHRVYDFLSVSHLSARFSTFCPIYQL